MHENNDEGNEMWYGIAMAFCAVGLGGFVISTARNETRGVCDLVGKKYIVTGANSGIGKATVTQLVSRGATVIMACRDLAAATIARQDILERAPDCEPENIRVKKLDLSSFQSIKQFAADVNVELPSLNGLINNAGMISPTYETRNGLELTMMTNYFGPFYLTTLLLPVLSKAGGAGRVVNVSSRLEKSSLLSESTIRAGPTGLLKPNEVAGYSPMSHYSDSKFCQLLATRGQAQAFKQHGIVVHAVTPGLVHTNLSRYVWLPLQYLVWPIQKLFLRTPAQGAASVLYAATAELPGQSTGKYWTSDKHGVCTEETGSPLSQSLPLAAALIKNSEKLVADAVVYENSEPRSR